MLNKLASVQSEKREKTPCKSPHLLFPFFFFFLAVEKQNYARAFECKACVCLFPFCLCVHGMCYCVTRHGVGGEHLLLIYTEHLLWIYTTPRTEEGNTHAKHCTEVTGTCIHGMCHGEREAKHVKTGLGLSQLNAIFPQPFCFHALL